MTSTQTFQIQKLPSSKLFFNKYVYKIEGNYPKANRFVSTLRSYPSHNSKDPFFLAMRPYIKRDDLRIRVENSIFGIYTNNKELVEEISNNMSRFVKNIYGPQSETEKTFLLTNSRTKIVRDKYPHNKFKFRVIMKTLWGELWSVEDRKKFADWLEPFSANDRTRLTRDTGLYLYGYRNWVSNPCCYVKTEQDLSMILMFLGDKVKSVEEFILRSDLVDQV